MHPGPHRSCSALRRAGCATVALSCPCLRLRLSLLRVNGRATIIARQDSSARSIKLPVKGLQNGNRRDSAVAPLSHESCSKTIAATVGTGGTELKGPLIRVRRRGGRGARRLPKSQPWM